jgi:DNA-binding NarL/FixJ family response regulator
MPTPTRFIPRPVLRVVVVDDDPLIRRALRELIDTEPRMALAAEVDDGLAALEICAREHPDVVIMDLEMPGLDGVTATNRLVRAQPRVRVLLLVPTDDERLTLLGLMAGAAGVLPKDVGDVALVRAARAVASGQAAITRSSTMALVHAARTGTWPLGDLPDLGAGVEPMSAETAIQAALSDLRAQNTI